MPTLNSDEAEAFADAVAAMDAADPKWFTKVNVEALDLSDSQNCIIGQVFGSYYDKSPVVEAHPKKSWDHYCYGRTSAGYDRDVYPPSPFCFEHYSSEWKRVIAERIAAEEKSNESSEPVTITADDLRKVKNGILEIDELINRLDPPKTVPVMLRVDDIAWIRQKCGHEIFDPTWWTHDSNKVISKRITEAFKAAEDAL